jgi:hypothetical protein
MRTSHQLGRLRLQRFGYLTQHRDAGRHVGAFDRANVPGAQPGPFGQLLLRHSFRMTQPTQIDRHDLLEIHGDDGADIGIIVPGMIIPIRPRAVLFIPGLERLCTANLSNVMRHKHRDAGLIRREVC